MSGFATSPTPYPDVNELLSLLLTETQTILASQFVGMYLHGSLANGEFDPRRSDIDFLVVTEGDLPDESQSALAGMHRGIASSRRRWSSSGLPSSSQGFPTQGRRSTESAHFQGG